MTDLKIGQMAGGESPQVLHVSGEISLYARYRARFLAGATQKRNYEEAHRMNALVIYDSQYGNTEQIAQTIAAVLREHGPVRVLAAGDAGILEFEAADFIAVGGPTQAHGPSHAMKELFREVPDKIANDTPAIAFDTRFHLPGWVSGMASDDIADHLHRIGCQLIMPHESFFVEGKEGPLSEGELERAANWTRIALSRLRLLEPVGSQI